MYLGNIISLNGQKTLVSMIIDKKKTIITVIILLLLLGNIFFGAGYFSAESELQKARKELKERQLNEKVISFSSLFIEKVLKSRTEVSFEDRLKLENAVRDMNDPAILALWEKFTDSKTQEEAQEAVKNLLDTLVKKLSY